MWDGVPVRSLLAAVMVATLLDPVMAQAPAGGVAMPAAVKKAFDQSYPGASVTSVSQQRDGSRQVVRVDATQRGRRRIVLYDANGTVVELSEPVEEKELPAPVAAAIKAHRRAIYVSGMKVTRGSSVEYRITVRGSRRTAMVAKPDGTVLSFQ